MPSPELMTWIPSQRRWTRMHNGKRYYVSCRQLGCPETKEGSLQAANAWWKTRKAELNAARLPVLRTPKPMEDLLAAMIGGKQWESIDAIADGVRCFLDQLPPSKEAETLACRAEEAAYLESEHGQQDAWEHVATALGRLLLPRMLEQVLLDNKPLPERLREHLPPARVNQLETAIKGIRGESATATDRTIKAHSDAWLAVLEKQAAAGQVTAARINNVRLALAHFTRWLGETVDVGAIDAAKLQGFYEHCLMQVAARRADKDAGWSTAFAKEAFAAARAWIRWLVEQDAIDPPRNLASRFRFGASMKEIEIWSIEEIRHVIGEAPGKLKLSLLLMIGCGMTQIDVADLLDTEVDWARGTITRRRSKAKNYENAPTVCYQLWPITFELLQQYRSGSERVLLTESGLPYVRCEMVHGKLRKVDGFASCYAHLKRRLGFKKSLKQLRKVGSTLLDRFDPSGSIATLYLGHSPRSVKDRHYSRPDQEHFNRALMWLGRQLGFVELDSPQAGRD